jgi:hypothetical protein
MAAPLSTNALDTVNENVHVGETANDIYGIQQ